MLNKQTTLDLNGPILSFTLQPSSVSVCDSGVAIFTGIASATFPTPATNTGYISYQWYDQNGPLSDSANVTGAATTVLTLSNLKSPTDHNRQFYLKADYVASAYGLAGVAVTVGSGRSTGNAVNDTLNSNTATITVYPVISITEQPTNKTVAQGISATFTAQASLTDTTQGSLSFRWQLNENDLSDSSTTIGSGTQTLSISSSTVSTSTVRAKITHPTSCSSPIYTNSVNFNVVSAREIVNFEFPLDTSSNLAFLDSKNLRDGSYVISKSQQQNSSILFCVLYAPEKDVTVFMDIYGEKGLDSGSYKGGEGGVSTIKLTLKKNEEYVLEGPNRLQSYYNGAIYLYRKARIISVVGGGGNAGSTGNGGDGGGVNVLGGNASGSGAGSGGPLYQAGTLPSNGIFGSIFSSVSLLPGDSLASIPNGGRVLPCTKGRYWRELGYSACADIGTTQLRKPNGTLVTNTASISRGFKDGYAIRQNQGGAISGGGQGGGGATGGNGGNGGGGGGGSGYTDGSVEIISTRQGGNTGEAKVVIRIADF
jgi:hypothetical protein